MDDFFVHISGFKTFEAAEQFASWYEGQGEQDIGAWWEYRLEEGLLVGEQPLVDFDDEDSGIDIDGSGVYIRVKN